MKKVEDIQERGGKKGERERERERERWRGRKAYPIQHNKNIHM